MRKAFSALACLVLAAKPGPGNPKWAAARACPEACLVEVLRWAEPGDGLSGELWRDTVRCRVVRALKGGGLRPGQELWVYRIRLRLEGWCDPGGHHPEGPPDLGVPPRQAPGSRMIALIEGEGPVRSLLGGDFGWIPATPGNLADLEAGLEGREPAVPFAALRDRGAPPQR